MIKVIIDIKLADENPGAICVTYFCRKAPEIPARSKL